MRARESESELLVGDASMPFVSTPECCVCQVTCCIWFHTTIDHLYFDFLCLVFLCLCDLKCTDSVACFKFVFVFHA